MNRSNQETLGSGCVCETGCDSCDSLASDFRLMQEALRCAEMWVGKAIAEGVHHKSVSPNHAERTLKLIERARACRL